MKSLDTKKLARALFELTDGKDESESKKAVQDFAQYLRKTRNLGHVHQIVSHYEKMFNEKNNILEVEVSILKNLPEKIRLELEESLKKKHNAVDVYLIEKIDPKVLGGMKIKIGDTVHDSSITNSLKQLQAQLLH